MPKEYKYELRSHVKINVTGEDGFIVARCDSTSCQDRYCIRYKAGDGRCVEIWWDEEVIEAF